MHVHRWRFFVATLIALAAATPWRAVSAQGTITGRVTAAVTGLPLAGARVLVVGSTLEATSAEDGRYTVRNVRVGSAEVQVLHVGYSAQKKLVAVTAGGTANLNFALAVVVVQLQEIVTTATGQQRKIELGNAISTLGDVSKRVEETPVKTIQDLLVGKAPGLVVLPNTVTGGAPVLRIRGLNSLSLSNAPIVIMDGVRMNSSNQSAGTGGTNYSMLNALNPDEIEDIEIVKGPSAATLYGTDAANGVVVITTKKGRAGNTRWTYFGEAGNISDRNHYQAQYANWGHAPGAKTQTRCMLATMGPTTCISDSLTSYDLLSDPSATFIVLGHRTQGGVSVSGGNDLVRYYASGDIQNEIGPVKMPDFDIQRYDSQNISVRDEWLHPVAMQQENFRVNLSAALSPNFDLSFNTGFIKSDNRLPQSDNNIFSLYGDAQENYGFKQPGLDQPPGGLGPLGEPLNGYLLFAPGEIMQYVRTQGVQRGIGSATAVWRPLSWLQNEGTAGIDFAARDDYQICHLNECPAFGTTRQGQITDNHNNQRYFSAKLVSNATWNARPWANLKTTIGADYINQESDFSNTGGTQLPAGGETVAAAASKTASNQQPTATKTLGFYAQEQGSFRDRLFLTAAVRSDQNSAFGTNFQRVLYPKFSASYLVSDESWFPKFDMVNQIRLRASYGASGVQPGSTSGLITFATTTVSLVQPGALTGTDTPGLRASSLGNANLKPETSAEFEGGFDARLFSSKANFEFTYYRKQTHDALISVPIAPSSAASSLNVLTNVGSTMNSGIEGQITASLVDTRRFGWDVTLSGSHNTNRVVDLGTDPITGKSRVIGTGQTRQVVGYPINGQWFHPYTFADANKDGVIQVAEVRVDSSFTFSGYAFPRDVFSIQSGFDLFSRAIRITGLFDYKGGYGLFDTTNEFNCNNAPFACRENQDPATPLWLQARNVAQNYGTAINGVTYKSQLGYSVNGQYWRFRELSIIAQLPSRAAKTIRAQSAALQLGARNLHWWGPYTGVDPESNQAAGDTQFDFQQASPPTYFTMRLNLKY